MSSSLLTHEDAWYVHKCSVMLFLTLSITVLVSGPLSVSWHVWLLWPIATWGSKLYAMHHFSIPNFKRYYWGRVTKENTWYTFHQYVYCTWFWVRFHPYCPIWLRSLDDYTNAVVLLSTVVVTPWELFCCWHSETEWSRGLRGDIDVVDSKEKAKQKQKPTTGMESFIALPGLRFRTGLMRAFELLIGMMLCHMTFGSRDLDWPRSSDLTGKLLWMSVYCTLTNHLQFFLGTITSKGYISKKVSAWLYAGLGQIGMMIGWSILAVRALHFNSQHGTVWFGSAPLASIGVCLWLVAWIALIPSSPWVQERNKPVTLASSYARARARLQKCLD